MVFTGMRKPGGDNGGRPQSRGSSTDRVQQAELHREGDACPEHQQKVQQELWSRVKQGLVSVGETRAIFLMVNAAFVKARIFEG